MACLRAAADAVDGTLTRAGYAAVAGGRKLPDGRRWPSGQTVELRFDGWTRATAAAGIGPALARRGGVSRHFTPERCRTAVREAARALGRPPTSNEYARLAQPSSGELPSLLTIRKNLGPWREVLRSAGL